MKNIVACLAVIGRFQLMPGTLPVKLDNPLVDYLVKHAFPDSFEMPECNISFDTSDCTLFEVTHKYTNDIDLSNPANMRIIFEQSIAAISEVAIWSKLNTNFGEMSPFIRQIGTTDVKAFFAQVSEDEMAWWINPSFRMARNAAAVLADSMPMIASMIVGKQVSTFIVENGPSANPVQPILRRVMASVDLINLGFHTESFVNLFSIVDDLTQEVIKKGMELKGLVADEQKQLLRAIKEERLKLYLCNLAKLCGWQSLEEADKELYANVLKVNKCRNDIMHGSLRISKGKTFDNCNILLKLIDWLRSNPFGFSIPPFPPMKIADAQFNITKIKKQ